MKIYKTVNGKNLSIKNQNLKNNNKQSNPINNPKTISLSINGSSQSRKPQLNNINNNNIKREVRRASLNIRAKTALLTLREQSKISNTLNKKPSKPPDKIPSQNRKIRNNSIDRNSNSYNLRLPLQQTSKRNKNPTNIQLNKKPFDNAKHIEVLSLSHKHSSVSDTINIAVVQTVEIDHKNCPTSIDKNNLNPKEEVSRSNLNNNYLQIDNKSENCRNLISENDKNESEKLKLQNSNNENLQCKLDDLNDSNKQMINRFETKIPIKNKFETKKPIINEFETKKPIITQFETKKPIITQFETKKTIITQFETKKPIITQFETKKPIINQFETETESIKSEIIKSDQKNTKDLNEIDNLSKPVKDFASSSKFEPITNRNKENSERFDGNQIISINQEINSSNVVSNSNQSNPPIKPTLLDNSNSTKLKIKTQSSPIKLIKPSHSNEKLQEPIGFENPKGYCFLNCVVQQFYSCVDFRNELIKFHGTSQIAAFNTDEKNIFVSNFCKLMDEINKRNVAKIKEIVVNIQEFFKYSSFGDDVHKCFMNILTVISNLTKKQNSKKSASTRLSPRDSFEMYRKQHEGFVFDLFYGQMAIKLVCTECEFEFNKRFQLFKSIPLPVPKSTETIPLENVIKDYLIPSPVDTDDIMDCRCPGGSKTLYSITEFTHMPSYLFIYLNRGSYFENGEKNNTFINCNEILTFPTGKSSTKYRLISVIDHIGDNYGGHYYAKSCFETDKWWILNDSFVNLIEDKKSIVSKQAIVFLLKKLSQ